VDACAGKSAILVHNSPRGISVPEFIDAIHKEWAVIGGAPWSFLIAIAAVGSALWIFLALIHRSEIAGKNSTIEAHKAQIESQGSGLKEQIAAMEQRLKLGAEAKDELDKQFQAYKAEVAARGSNASPAKVEAAIIKVADSNTNIGSSLLKLHRWLEVDQDGAQVTRQSLPRGAGYPLDKNIGLTLNSIPDDVKKRE
jgi:hypothetical protein